VEETMTGRTRQEQERPLYEDDYNPLKIPTEVKERFLDEGKALMWVRHMIKGQSDWMNLRKKEEFGWSTVKSEECQELATAAVTALPDDRFSDCIVRGDLVLMQCSAEKVEARKQYFKARTQEQEDAVNHQLMASSDSRLPITNQSRSRITTGRPQFDS
jgi:hypothetical protein